MTRYMILQRDEIDGVSWQEYGHADATSPSRAIRAANANPGPGVYVAVPARSWKPLTVKVEQTTRVTVETA